MVEKKRFKDTKFGQWLAKVGKATPEVMEKVGNAVGGPWGQVVATVGNALDKAIEKDPDNQDIADTIEEFKELEELFRMEYEYHTLEVQEITKRWESDNNSDSWLAKNVRPIVLLVLLTSYVVLSVLDSIETLAFNTPIGYISGHETLLVTAFVAYFGGRTYEKSREKRRI